MQRAAIPSVLGLNQNDDPGPPKNAYSSGVGARPSTALRTGSGQSGQRWSCGDARSRGCFPMHSSRSEPPRWANSPLQTKSAS